MTVGQVKRQLKVGSRVCVWWVDIQAGINDEFSESGLASADSSGTVHSFGTQEGVEYVVIRSGGYPDATGDSVAIPLCVIYRVGVIHTPKQEQAFINDNRR